nr:hypothetical protein [Tanacetum cinerariifolium]
MVEVKVLMAFADDENIVVGKEDARNGEWVKILIKRAFEMVMKMKKIQEAVKSTWMTLNWNSMKGVFWPTPKDPLKRFLRVDQRKEREKEKREAFGDFNPSCGHRPQRLSMP